MDRKEIRKDRIDATGASILIIFSALLGLNQVFIKLVNVGLQPVFHAGLRSFCAFFPVLLFAWLMRRKLDLGNGSLIPGLIAGSCFGLEFILMFVGLDYTSVANASILFYTMPLWVAIGVHFLVPGESLNLLRMLGIVLAIFGVVIALLGSGKIAGQQQLMGDLFCLAASFLWAAIVLIARTTALSRSTPEMQLLYQLGVSAPILLLVSLLFGDWLRDPDLLIWSIFAIEVIVVVSIGFLVWFWVLSVYPASDMAVFSFLAPLFGVIFSWLILDESINWRVWFALILVSIGIVLVNFKPRSRASGAA